MVSANNHKTTVTIDNGCFTALECIWPSHNVCQSSYKYSKVFNPLFGGGVVKLILRMLSTLCHGITVKCVALLSLLFVQFPVHCRHTCHRSCIVELR